MGLRIEYSKLQDALINKLRLKDLALLLSIANRKSLSVVADELGTTQPAVSRLLKEIEAVFGTALFERDRASGMRPTSVGALVLARAHALLADVGAMSAELEAFASGTGGHLRLGVIPFVSGHLLQTLVLELIGSRYRMSVTVTEGSTDQLVQALRQHVLDVVIGRMLVTSHSGDIHQEPLFRQKAALVAHPEHPFVTKTRFDLADLVGQMWLLPPRESPTRVAINEAFIAAQLSPPTATIETASTKLIYNIISARPEMLGVVPAEIGRDLERLGGVRSLQFPSVFNMPPVALITLRGRQNMPSVKNLRQSLRDHLSRGIPIE